MTIDEVLTIYLLGWSVEQLMSTGKFADGEAEFLVSFANEKWVEERHVSPDEIRVWSSLKQYYERTRA